MHPAADWQRIETWTGTGIPDVNACQNGVEIWTELKQLKPKKDGTIRLDVKKRSVKAQYSWMMKRHRAGGKCFYGVVIGRKLFIVPFIHAYVLLEGVMLDKLPEFCIEPKEIFNV